MTSGAQITITLFSQNFRQFFASSNRSLDMFAAYLSTPLPPTPQQLAPTREAAQLHFLARALLNALLSTKHITTTTTTPNNVAVPP